MLVLKVHSVSLAKPLSRTMKQFPEYRLPIHEQRLQIKMRQGEPNEWKNHKNCTYISVTKPSAKLQSISLTSMISKDLEEM